jgi:tetratricopeptide (TPR) repeat protein
VAEALLDLSQLDSLLEAMLEVPGLTDSDVRDARVEELTRLLRRPLDAPRFADTRNDLSSLINACHSCSGGLRTFASLLRRYDAGAATARVVALSDDLVGPVLLSPADRDVLNGHLTGIAVEQIAAAVGELVDAADLRNIQVWRDIPAAIRALEGLPLPDDGVPQLLTFTDRLAQVVGGTRAYDLRRWIDTVAGGLGVDPATLDQLRATSERGTAGGRLPSAGIRVPSTVSQPPRPRRSDESGLIWGGVPIRNRNFSGRVVLLERLGDALRTSSKASVLPQALHGMGGVGKTQLVVEYVYRHLGEYDLVWWIAAEQTSSVLTSLTLLAERLNLPTTPEDRQQTARTVLDHLAGSELSWLLVYDNADDPVTLSQYVPTTGGHVILTTRNLEWSTVGEAIEVDVFERHESIELLQRRSRDPRGEPHIQPTEADLLAEKLGDLPLALEQAAAWCLATAMPASEYIELLDSHIKDLLDEGTPATYPVSVAAFVTVAVDKLRDSSPAAAQLFELFAFLGGEPVAVSMLRRGNDADITEPLRTTLGAPIPTNRTVRELNRYGLAKVDPLQRVQVHRLVQRVLHDSLSPERAEQTLRNTQRLLFKANPGDPDEYPDAARPWDLGPHIDASNMIDGLDIDARQVVLDHARYLYITGDYENSLALARRAADAWERDASNPRLGPDGELTLRARAQVANATRTLGDSSRAAAVARDAYDRMRANPTIGREHEFALILGNQVGADLRIAGRYRDAFDFDTESVELHRAVFGSAEPYTLRALANLAVDHRMIGNFAEAYALDQEIADHWEDVGVSDPRALAAYINLARSCYGLGAYRLGLEILERWRPALQDTLGAGNSQVLLSGRTHAILLRKLGRLTEAVEIIRENAERVQARFGINHEFSVAATVSHANALRDAGDLDESFRLIADALHRYDENFGATHPLTLVARVNAAIIHRARAELTDAHALDEACFEVLADVLGSNHPYTICAGVGLATDLAQAGQHRDALDLSVRMLELSRETATGGHDARDGAEHPYLLMRTINLSHDLRAAGDRDRADTLFAESLAGLRLSLGTDHPEVFAVERGSRTESDIEPPPT